ncbi:hypothetical protein M422DRAFT_786132 [Sphaerobolus stellatus SS14]|uniref:Uncharacterized protein n=1 Tax=Sphaerobolus stellatus (strain SS14) TaxID=990650 RepID=A0A0C9UDP7_SPHS4|nr:hypothetical protein M422DRAFT_786132 [Sphaerobolus stellatus SS14]
MAGLAGLPAMTFYCASKYAVEGFSEALSKELNPEWNIKVVILALGNFKTNAVQTILDIKLPSLEAYKGGVIDYMRGAFSPTAGADPVKGAAEIYRIAHDSALPARTRFLLGADVVGLAKGQIKQLQEDTDASEPLAPTLA